MWVLIGDAAVDVARSCDGAVVTRARGEWWSRVWLLEEDDVTDIEVGVEAAEGKCRL